MSVGRAMAGGGQVLRNGLRFAVAPVWDAGASLRSTLSETTGRSLRGDALAGLTVAMVAVPQSMAFASIAGLPPIYGLYAAIVAPLAAVWFTSSRHSNFGPTNTMSLLTASGLAVVATQPDQLIATAVMLALLAGLIQIAFAMLRLGDLVRFVSQSVIVGFSAGAGVLIIVGQLPDFLGIGLRDTASRYVGVGEKIDRAIQAMRLHGDGIDWQPIAVGLLSLVVVLVCRRISRWLPAYLLAVVAGAVVVVLAGWDQTQLRLVGQLPHGLPALTLPSGDIWAYRPLLGPALAIALVGMLEAYSMGKTLATNHGGPRINANQELLALGAQNLASAFFRGLPGSASWSRSALNAAVGSQSRFASFFSGLAVAGAFLLLAPAARYIPMASIAAILFVIAWGLLDFDYLRRVARSNTADLLVCVGTFVATLLLPLEIAVFAGIFLTIALYLQRAKQLYITEMIGRPGVAAGFIERPLKDRARCLAENEDTAAGDFATRTTPDNPDASIVFLQVEGNLFFAAADDLQDRFQSLLQQGVQAVVLRLKRTHLVDATIMFTLQQFAEQLQARGRHLILCGVRERMYERMDAFGLVTLIGAENIFISGDEPFRAAKQAVERARELVATDMSATTP